jgi:hypothetical protein
VFELETVSLILSDETSMFECTAYREQQLIEFHWLQQEINCAAFHEIYREGGFILRGKEYDFHARIFLFHFVEEIRTRQIRHSEIEDAEVGSKRIELGWYLAALGEARYFIAAAREKLTDKCNDLRLIVDDEDF